jgi:hypothetical protein
MRAPKNAVTVSTYAEFDRFAGAFAEGHFNLLIVLGGPGLSKTRLMRKAVGPSACCIEGHVTPFGVYRLLWQYKDRPIVLDDADSLFLNAEGIRLMKAMCQTEAVKRISWHSDNRTLKEEDIPREFETRSKVAIVANQWCPKSADVEALEDRGHILLFRPSALEVHRKTAEWFWDQEIFDFFAAHLGLITEPSMRHYLAAWELMQAGMDWKTLILSRFISGPTLLVAKLKADPSFPSEKARVEAFIDAGGGCRTTYFDHARRLNVLEEVPRIVLTNPAPAAGQLGDQPTRPFPTNGHMKLLRKPRRPASPEVRPISECAPSPGSKPGKPPACTHA